MSSNQYTRERKEDEPVLAICYDFDKTLSPDDMQAQGYIQSVGYDVGEFWTESNGLASQNDIDQNLAYLLYRQHALQRDYLILITNCIKTVAWSICRPKKKSCCYTREFFALTC